MAVEAELRGFPVIKLLQRWQREAEVRDCPVIIILQR